MDKKLVAIIVIILVLIASFFAPRESCSDWVADIGNINTCETGFHRYTRQCNPNVFGKIFGIPQNKRSKIEDLQCKPCMVRYIKIQKNTAAQPNKIINLTAVNVFSPTGENLSIQEGVSAFSKDGIWHDNNRAILGPACLLLNNTSSLGTGPTGCKMFHSNTSQDNPWITIDLGTEKLVSRVELINRTDCCKERSLGVAVSLLNKDMVTVRQFREISEVKDNYSFENTLNNACA